MLMHISLNLIRCNGESKGNFQKVVDVFLRRIFPTKILGVKMLTNPFGNVLVLKREEKNYVDNNKLGSFTSVMEFLMFCLFCVEVEISKKS